MPRSSSKKRSSRKKSSPKSLAVMIRQIAKKNNITLPGSKPARVAPPMPGIQPVNINVDIPQVKISAPADRPCGTNAKGDDRYTRGELIELARAQGVNTKQNMDLLCKALGINPRAIGGVMVEKKDCGSKARGDDRYTREDVEALARSRNIPVKGKSMDELCADLGLQAVAVPAPRGSASASLPRAPPRSASLPRLPAGRVNSSLSSRPAAGYTPSAPMMPMYSDDDQSAIDSFLSPRMMSPSERMMSENYEM
jgi:hypothetical protein